jgi:transcription-repair coupling factor (superfamily II helicase)
MVEQATTTPDRLRELSQRLSDCDGFAEVLSELRSGGQAALDGVWGSSCALLAAELARHAPSWLVVVCPSQEAADQFADDLPLFSTSRIFPFPAWESELGERIVHDEIYGQRLHTLKQLDLEATGASNQPVARVIVSSVQSLLQPAPAPETIRHSTRRLAVGDVVRFEDLRHWLVEQGFHHTSAVELPGEFSARGGLLDIFAADWERPVRVELFGDEIESIRRFEVTSQRSIETLEQVEITVLSPGVGAAVPFTDHVPDDTWVLQVEPEQIQDEAARYLGRLESTEGFFGYAAIQRDLLKFPHATASAISLGSFDTSCRLPIESVERFSGEINKVRDELDESGEGHQVFVLATTQAELERLAEILQDTRLNAEGNLHFCRGSLQQGFRLSSDRVILISSAELFQRGELRRTTRRRLGKAIDSFLDLREGDLVVHLSHGIGRYRGLQMLDRDGQVEEHLQLEFHGGTKVYVPATKIGLVQKYVGGARSRPQLARIGGKTWVRQKQAAEAAVADLAADMLELQAQRLSRPGIAFSPDSDWQREFDASFPYEETADQRAAIQSIKSDMVVTRPMDRLLCGDVGFGKTEVAMRAAFKAVDSGYQVAVLVPTTILAEQHYRTFRDRMAEFPFDIAKLSRFCSAREQRETIEGLAAGRIDVVIGTHRLASRDVEFYNLGLVVIDEEQRFGVEVKERLKQLRSTVDVMTMTATPIPRTLHMSLVGVRDISNLETAPEDRLAVETRVTRFNNELIRHAILRELNRNGQVYFVHNRVNDIELVAGRLRDVVPEARLRIGHGQMPETELEQVMVDFVAHKFDVLVATTIVESGLDIPNANTIFIDEADRYGLADLHQLRGRVGRYKHRAYCYLLVDPAKHITPNAARRLLAIEEFSDMGAGFAIAMRDLEIRGAGNLLGTEQSGHISAVGYELYCQLLESAVRQLKNLPPEVAIDVDLDVPGEAFLPDEYVPDMRFKIDLYRRLARIADVGELNQLRAELHDRFGPPTKPVLRLLELAELRIDAAIWQIAAIFVEDEYLVFRYGHRPRIEQLARLSGGRMRVVDDKSAYLEASQQLTNPGQLLELLKSVLRPNCAADYNPAPH